MHRCEQAQASRLKDKDKGTWARWKSAFHRSDVKVYRTAIKIILGSSLEPERLDKDWAAIQIVLRVIR